MALNYLLTFPTMATCGGCICIFPHILAPPAGPPAEFSSGFELPKQRTFGTAHNRLIRSQMNVGMYTSKTFQRCYIVLPILTMVLIVVSYSCGHD